MTDTYLSLGSNLGDRHYMIVRAIELLARRVGRLVCVSSIVETEPWGFKSIHPFLNAVVLLHTDLTPRQLLAETQAIERELGRTKKTQADTYADRPIDIDILLYGERQVNETDLIIPHPLMNERDFVIKPLQEIHNSLQKKYPIA
ncbi:MAG: 2-amino-4-hydroxy-6-hydroxymethyldihydropteridine diphosphokinase [Bacteroidaceae bacterium]|nr:2-amino-4-hydroxy-6-hydroxymethyldihydropteridine diphosphokinase [Bacteroidaceae bacterium]